MNRRAAALVVLALAAVLAGLALSIAMVRGGEWTRARELWLARGSGWVALVFLAGALVATPVGRVAARLGRRSRVAAAVPRLRRASGIAAAVLALVHAAVALGGWLEGAWDAVLTWPYLRAGLLALLVLVALLVTSFPRVVRALRVRLWKPLHRLSYVAAALVLVHLLLSPFAARVSVLVLFGALLAVGLGRLVSPRPARARPRSPERS